MKRTSKPTRTVSASKARRTRSSLPAERPKPVAPVRSSEREGVRMAGPEPGAPVSHRFPVVGIGASAGGLEALGELLAAMPADTGMAFVVVTHQHPGHATLLPELLAKSTALPVVEATDGLRVEPNHVYVGTPGGQLAILNGLLQRLETEKKEAPHLPIDYFLRSLAQDQRETAICIILSGTGTDGTLGLKAIKGESGMAMVQQVQSARYAGMPSSAVATGLADYVLPPAEMPRQLVAYARGPYLAAGGLPVGAEAPPLPAEPLQKIFVLLRARTGHDFSSYKVNTIRRRIERRMNLHQIRGPAQYLRYLQENPHELDILFKELLIGVTSFFRDPDAFAGLAKLVLLEQMASRPDNDTFRIWVPGCATGEEVYSLAILLREGMDELKRHVEVQLFGTDLDSEAIGTARNSVYPDGIAVDVSPQRLERFFVREDGSYRIRKDIREMAVFAVQNVVKDPPFTRLDLISCRNLLIYLNADVQKRLLPMFHFALKPGGVLLLGPSETIGGFSDLFEVLDKKWKIFRRKESSLVPHPVLELPSAAIREEVEAPAGLAASTARPAKEPDITRVAEKLLLRHFAPASVVVNDRGDVVYIHGRTGLYLEPSAGHPRLNVLDMAREGLQVPLASALRQAATQTGEVIREGVRVRTNGDFIHVTLSVMKIQEPETVRGLLLVTFRPCPLAETTPRPHGGGPKPREADRAEELERELQHTRESLQTTIEELETSNEELKSTNEELQSTNEELQSTNEELETSKEEMQSLNEELTTVNTEMQSKVEDLSRANDDMQNLLNSTEVATIFLDNELHIKRYTEQARRLIKFIQSDVGRPLADLASSLNYSPLVPDCREVLRTLAFKQTEVRTNEGWWYLMRIMPYRTAENVIDGLVLTFVDINAVKRAEQELAATKEHLAFDLDAMTRLHRIGTLFVRQSSLEEILEEVLDAAIFITKADLGNLQLLDPASGRLRIRAQRGFKEAWLDFWDNVDPTRGTCGAALKKGERILVEDVTQSPIFAGRPDLDVQLKAGVRAVQSSPLISCKDRLIGVVSTHFHAPHRPDERELRLLDLLCRLTSEILDRAVPDPASFPAAGRSDAKR